MKHPSSRLVVRLWLGQGHSGLKSLGRGWMEGLCSGALHWGEVLHGSSGLAGSPRGVGSYCYRDGCTCSRSCPLGNSWKSPLSPAGAWDLSCQLPCPLLAAWLVWHQPFEVQRGCSSLSASLAHCGYFIKHCFALLCALWTGSLCCRGPPALLLTWMTCSCPMGQDKRCLVPCAGDAAKP